jgi:putative intracellular protease/amidase
VVVDGHLITSRKPDDLPDFCRAIIASLSAEPVAAGPSERRGRARR